MAKKSGGKKGMAKGKQGPSGFGGNKDLSGGYVKSPSAMPMKGCK